MKSLYLNSLRAVLFALFAVQTASLTAQTHATTIPALLLSDIHFDPFLDPGKVAQLNAAPVTEWKKILDAPASADLSSRLDALTASCHSKGVDTSEALLQSSLAAMRAQAAGIAFITLSGDLMAHQFDCKYKALLPQATADDYRSFAEKTLDYVQREIRDVFPSIPVYVAMGNNDSDCGDYQIDANSKFLAAEGAAVASLLPEAERKQAAETFAAAGYYSVSLPAPIQHTRLLVLNNLFLSKNYATCSGKPDPSGAEQQLHWLRQQLDAARANKEKIWVMAHIPPGVNLYSTASKGANICAGKKPVVFLSSDELPELLTQYGDLISLALFGHTHNDELRLLISASQKPEEAKPHSAIPLKIVPSISPVHGNNPAFTLAQIDATTSSLKDYRVFVASNQSGVAATWSEEYNYAHSYKQPAFDSPSVRALLRNFAEDSSARGAESQQYLNAIFPGSHMPILQLFWPQYVCSLNHYDAAGFAACACASLPALAR